MGFCGGGGGGGSGGAGMGFRRARNHPDPSEIGGDVWAIAEGTIQEVVNCVHPTMDSEERRKDVTEFMQKLLKCYLNCDVYPYGSVPLKTYLPDGDIDLTAVSIPENEESLAHNVLAVLQAVEQNGNAEYYVRDTQFIDAEVKLIKCVVEDIVIDISFNQLGGLCTLCFLEQVDRIVDQNHLFKRSILLIKCWCYHESRILGAHHGLISTYGLEILILYIFQLFHESLNNPVAVLYRFLDYYSKFDWEKYCISLSGPVCKSSLPELVVEMPGNGKNNFLLSEEFLANCMEMFSVPSSKKRGFQQKHLNIIDPLKENNNLGRSVHRANFYRICSAFKYGVRRLGRILSLPPDKIGDEMKKFFANTIERHGCNHLANLKNSSLIIGAESSGILSSPSHADLLSEDDFLLKSPVDDFEHDSFEMEDKCTSLLVNESSDNDLQLCQPGDANDLATPNHLNPNSANDTSESSSGASFNVQEHCGPHFSSAKLSAENGGGQNGKLCQNETSDRVDEKLASGSSISVPKSSNLEDGLQYFRERDSASVNGDSEVWNPLADLTGDYDCHIRSLLYGKLCHSNALPVEMSETPFPSWFQYNKFLAPDQQTMPPEQLSLAQTNMNTMLVGPLLYPTAAYAVPSIGGTGTFLPNPDYSFKERPFRGRGSRGFGGYGQQNRRNNRKPRAPGSSSRESVMENSSQETSHGWLPAEEPGKYSASRQSHNSIGDSCGNDDSNSLILADSGLLVQSPGDSSFGSSHAVAVQIGSYKVQKAKPGKGRKDRVAGQSVGVKNDEFAPSLPVNVPEESVKNDEIAPSLPAKVPEEDDDLYKG